MPGQVTNQLTRYRCELITYLRWRVPATVAVVDDEGKDGWESRIGIEIIPNETLENTDRIVEHAQRHAGVDRRLELEEHQQIEPFPLDGLHLPQQVGVPLTEVLCDEAGWIDCTSSIPGSSSGFLHRADPAPRAGNQDRPVCPPSLRLSPPSLQRHNIAQSQSTRSPVHSVVAVQASMPSRPCQRARPKS